MDEKKLKARMKRLEDKVLDLEQRLVVMVAAVGNVRWDLNQVQAKVEA